VVKEIAARMTGPILIPLQPVEKRKRYTVLMTEFGGTGDRQASAYGGMVDPDAFEVALPCKVPAAQRSIAIYRGGRSCIARVNDLGPWNMHDDYWNHGGRPKAERQKIDRNRADDNLVPTNSAGLDATRAVFDELGIRGRESNRRATVNGNSCTRQSSRGGRHPIPPPKPPPLIEPRPWWSACSAWG
jgi:hypothetical protein